MDENKNTNSKKMPTHFREWVTFEDHPLTRSKLNCTTPMMFVTSLGDNPKKEKKINAEHQQHCFQRLWKSGERFFFACEYIWLAIKDVFESLREGKRKDKITNPKK